MNVRVPLSQALASPAVEPAISEPLRLAVIAAVRWAWALVRQQARVDPMADCEEAITNELDRLLNARDAGERLAPGLRLFETVHRSAQQRAAGPSFRQSPDLTFRPKGIPSGVIDQSAWALFAECKVIARPSCPPRLYCDDGVQRFADGRYAPKMANALMVAYVRDGSKPLPTLRPRLADRFGTREVRAGTGDEWLAHSVHDRGGNPVPCVAIEIAHVWLDARSPSP